MDRKKLYFLRITPSIITEKGVFCGDNQRFLVDYHFRNFSARELILDGLQFHQASPHLIAGLFNLIHSQKSLIKLSLKDTNINAINIPFRKHVHPCRPARHSLNPP